MARKIDPLNKKQYGAVTAILTVADIKAAVSFYKKAFGFTERGIMKGPDRKPIHAELTLRGTTIMLGPENLQRGAQTAKTLGSSPTTLYLTVEDAEKTMAKAVKLGATSVMPVMEMFWGDLVGNLVDPDGYSWMIATHVADPTPQQMMAKMKEQMKEQSSTAAA
jgi:PhnB protein